MSDNMNPENMQNDAEESWARDLVTGYVMQYREFMLQSYMSELEHIDSYVEFMGYDLPNANEIFKRIMFNVRRQENRNKR